MKKDLLKDFIYIMLSLFNRRYGKNYIHIVSLGRDKGFNYLQDYIYDIYDWDTS